MALSEGTSIEIRDAMRTDGRGRKGEFKGAEALDVRPLPATLMRARADKAPDGVKDSIRSAALATVAEMLGPDFETTDRLRLDAATLGAKLTGLISDAPVIATKVVVVLADMAPKARVLEAGDDDAPPHVEAPESG